MSRETTVARLLARTFGVLVVLILLSGSAGVAASVLQHRSVRELTERVLPLRVANAQLRAVLADAQRGLRGYLLTGDVQFLKHFEVAGAAYPATEATVRGLARGADGSTVELQVRRAQDWWTLAQRQRQAAPRSVQAAGFVEEGKRRFDLFLAANDELDAELARRAERLAAQSEAVRMVTSVALALLTVSAGLLAAVAAGRTTRRITGPLRRLAAVLDRLGGGDLTARAALGDDPMELGRVAGAVNTMADEVERARAREQESARLRSAARELGVRVRQHLAVDAALREAGQGLGEMVDADHVVVRLAAGATEEPLVELWSRAGAEPAALTGLHRLELGWLERCGGTWMASDVGASGEDLPEDERRALLHAGAGAVLTVAVGAAGDHLGGMTLIRSAGRPAWSPTEARIAELVAADLGRGVHHATLYEQEQQLVLRLKELDTAKTDFMSTVSHELRTPLTSIAGYVEMLRDEDAGPVTADQAKMLEVIDRNARRLRALIGDLLILSKIEAGTFKTQRKTVELASLVNAARVAIMPRALKAGVAVEIDVDGPLELPADGDQIYRVLANLLSNAVKFTAAGGTVQVRGYRDGGEVVLVVSDSGMGVPEAEQHGLFSRFFRASNAANLAVPGTGLGLAIVHTIVQNHDGRIGLVSREGEGTTVTVRLPGH